MRKLARLLLAGLLAFSAPVGFASIGLAQVGPINPILCDKIVPFTGNGALQQIIAGGANNINFCGWHITSTSSTTTTFQIATGTGTNCGTNTVNITPAMNVTITAPSVDHPNYASWSAGTGNSICVNAPATVDGVLYYSNRA